MSAGWRTVRLAEICTFNYGKALPERARSGGDTPVFGSNGVVGFHDVSITNGRTIVIGRKGSFGEVNFSQVPCWPIDTAYFVDEGSTDQDIRWLYYRLGALGLNQMNKAAAVPGLNRDDAYRKQIQVPPLAEQRLIAAILDKADALRTQRREALAQLDRLAQAIFVEMFGDPATNPKGWPRVNLGKLLASGPQNGLYKPASDYGSGVPILRIDAFYDGEVTGLARLKRLRADAKEMALYGLHENEIVINRVNSPEYLGKSALIPPLPEPVVFESNMMRFALKAELVVPRYVIAFLQTSFVKMQIKTSSKDAVNQSSINQQDVKGFLINLPPISLQQTFADRLVEIERLRSCHAAEISEMGELFASLQHRAFLGEL